MRFEIELDDAILEQIQSLRRNHESTSEWIIRTVQQRIDLANPYILAEKVDALSGQYTSRTSPDKIARIKAFREITRMGLVDGKNFVERYFADNGTGAILRSGLL